jgi:hypothetical protein
MNRPVQINHNSEKFLLPSPEKELLTKVKKPPTESKSKRSIYPDVRMPKQPDGFLKAKRHTLF